MSFQSVPHTAEVLSRLLLFGDAATRLRIAADVASGDLGLTDLLAQTARSDEDPDLRVACVEVLGRALETADAETRIGVLTSLFGSAPNVRRGWDCR
jgi:hypothetical protein